VDVMLKKRCILSLAPDAILGKSLDSYTALHIGKTFVHFVSNLAPRHSNGTPKTTIIHRKYTSS
jgi:hypothetical protein